MARSRGGGEMLRRRRGRGSAAGDYNLAACHERGAGVPRDVERRSSCTPGRSPSACSGRTSRWDTWRQRAGEVQPPRITSARCSRRTRRATSKKWDSPRRTPRTPRSRWRACTSARRRCSRRRADDAESTSAAVAAVGRLRTVGGTRGESEETARAAARAAAALDAARPETRSETSPDELRGDALAAEAEARALVARAAEMGDARARCAWGARLWADAEREPEAKAGDEEKTTREEAIRWVIRAAADGIGEAWTWLGDVARDGRGGGTPDARLARRLYAEATALEDAAGTARLAEMEEREWTEAKERGELHLLPTAPTLAWRPDV